MKKISLAGIGLGLIVGAMVAMLSGSWIFWLAMGMALGVLLGSAGARRTQRENMRPSRSV